MITKAELSEVLEDFINYSCEKITDDGLKHHLTLKSMSYVEGHLEKNPSSQVVIGSHSVGDYGMVSKYGDEMPEDPWCIGIIDEVGKDQKGDFIRIYEYGNRKWRNFKPLTKEQGDKILKERANYR